MPRPDERDHLKAELSARLVREMTTRSWTQADLARAAERHMPKGEEFRRANVSSYVNKLALPRPKQLTALAKALGMDPRDLLPGGSASEDRLPFSMHPAKDEPGMAWLQVDTKVSMRTALAILGMLEHDRV